MPMAPPSAIRAGDHTDENKYRARHNSASNQASGGSPTGICICVLQRFRTIDLLTGCVLFGKAHSPKTGGQQQRRLHEEDNR